MKYNKNYLYLSILILEKTQTLCTVNSVVCNLFAGILHQNDEEYAGIGDRGVEIDHKSCLVCFFAK